MNYDKILCNCFIEYCYTSRALYIFYKTCIKRSHKLNISLNLTSNSRNYLLKLFIDSSCNFKIVEFGQLSNTTGYFFHAHGYSRIFSYSSAQYEELVVDNILVAGLFNTTFNVVLDFFRSIDINGKIMFYS